VCPARPDPFGSALLRRELVGQVALGSRQRPLAVLAPGPQHLKRDRQHEMATMSRMIDSMFSATTSICPRK
jgi:hypothetical protein